MRHRMVGTALLAFAVLGVVFVKYSLNGQPVTSFNPASNHAYISDGERQGEMEWFRVSP